MRTEKSPESQGKAGRLVDTDGYDELLQAAVARAPATEALESPVELPQIDPKVSAARQGSALAGQTWFRALCVLCVVAVIGFFSVSSGKGGLDPEAAKRELEKKYGSDYQVIEAVDGLMTPKVPFTSSEDPAFVSAISKLNRAIEASSGTEVTPLHPDDFRFQGDQFVMVSPARGG